MKCLVTIFALFLATSASRVSTKNLSHRHSKRFEPTWKSLDTRKAPVWYDQAKFGIFLHWGLYSVPGLDSEWFWQHWKTNVPEYTAFMKKYYAPKFQYQDFSPNFDAAFFDPDHFANAFYSAGAKYVVLTSKHHEGFTLWDSSFSWNWNSVRLPPHRNLLLEVAAAVRKRGMKFCVYYSLLEWYHPLYTKDQSSNFTTREFVDTHTIPQLKELINLVKPDCIWSDGDWPCTSDYWRSREFLAWLYNDSPVKDTVLVNDRWGEDSSCRHGDFKNCKDDFQPTEPPKFKWEDAFTLDRGVWGHRHNISHHDVKSVEYVTKLIAKTISMGGNILMNVGISSKGTIEAIFQERMQEVGIWMNRNGRGIYNTTTCQRKYENTTFYIYYTCREQIIYAFLTVVDRHETEFCSFLYYVRPKDSTNGSASIKILGHTSIPKLVVLKDKIKICLDLDTFLDVHKWTSITYELENFEFVK